MDAVDSATRRQNKLKNLPRWAQNEIERLEKNIEHYRKLLAQTDPTKTRIGWGMHTTGERTGDAEAGIPEDERVVFRLEGEDRARSGRRELWVRLLNSEGDYFDGIEIVCSDGVLHLEPRSSNVVRITQRGR